MGKVLFKCSHLEFRYNLNTNTNTNLINMKRYILNPRYVLRSEGNKVYILVDHKYQLEAYLSVIHPIFAMILSFFKGGLLCDILDEISTFFQLEKSKIEKLVTPLLENKNVITNGSSAFPKQIIIEYKEDIPIHNYSPFDFKYKDIDLQISRFKAPSDIICNITMKCLTSCIYCYADRAGNQNKTMPITLLEKIIKEAKELKVVRFRLMGGEVLLYKEWEAILKKMAELDFQPSISTKIPLTERHLDIIRTLDLNKSPIQFSLDTMIKDHLYQILNIKDPYYDNMIKCFDLMEKYNMDYMIHTVLTNKNDSIKDIESLISFFNHRKNIKRWFLDTAKCSMYIGKEYKTYKSTISNINAIREYLTSLIKEDFFDYEVKLPVIIPNVNNISKEEKKEKFEKRTMCAGNLNALYILPDGKVTICEELYWHPRFILGDLNKQSLSEIWNSQKANDLFYIKQNDIQKSSPCASCEDFKECHSYKHLCWRDVIWAYGMEKWDYPDPYCPKAPHIEKDITL